MRTKQEYQEALDMLKFLIYFGDDDNPYTPILQELIDNYKGKAKLIRNKVCGHCGNNIFEEYNFCHNCGCEIEKEEDNEGN